MLSPTRVALLALLLTGECGPSAPDAGPADAASGSGRIQLGFEADEERRPDGWELVSAHLNFDAVRLDNDRGDGFEPVWTRPDGRPLGRVRLDEDPPQTELSAVPATYGGVALTSGQAPTLELVYRVEEARIRVVSERGFDIMSRCGGGGARLRPGGAMHVEVRLDAGSIAQLLAEDIPPPDEGTVLVTGAPLVRVETALADAWITRCELGDDD